MNASARGARIVLGCDPSLERLFSTVYGVEEIVTPRTAIPPFEYHRSLMSLPGLFGITADTIPGAIPYLEADPALAVYQSDPGHFDWYQSADGQSALSYQNTPYERYLEQIQEDIMRMLEG